MVPVTVTTPGSSHIAKEFAAERRRRVSQFLSAASPPLIDYSRNGGGLVHHSHSVEFATASVAQQPGASLESPCLSVAFQRDDIFPCGLPPQRVTKDRDYTTERPCRSTLEVRVETIHLLLPLSLATLES